MSERIDDGGLAPKEPPEHFRGRTEFPREGAASAAPNAQSSTQQERQS